MKDRFTAEELLKNYTEFRNRINLYFSKNEVRLNALNKMYDHFEDRIIYTPASSQSNFHNAFPGGYIDHVMRVIDFSIEHYNLYIKLGISVDNISKESLLFCALNHDLGKLGSEDEDLYIPNDSEWHVLNHGKIYKFNPNLNFMDVNSRTFYLLNHFGVKLTDEEWIGIKLTDGMYVEDNKQYYVSYDNNINGHLPYILHSADSCASRVENEQFNNNKQLLNG